MYEMAVSRQADVWKDHKRETRDALTRAAVALVQRGVTPTVAQAAEEAGISRATAYRYFPTQEALLFDVYAGTSTTEGDELASQGGTDDVSTRLERLVDGFNRVAVREEAQWRVGLRVHQDTWLEGRRKGIDEPVVREGRRMGWLDQVLGATPNLSAEQRRRLQCALALTVGIDSIAIMKDVCRLDDEEALAVLRWSAAALLSAGLDGPGTGRPATTTST